MIVTVVPTSQASAAEDLIRVLLVADDQRLATLTARYLLATDGGLRGTA